MFDIKVDEQNSCIEVELGGMMQRDEVSSYVAELKRQFVVHRMRSYAMVIDTTKCPIQSQETIKAMGEHMATMPKARSIAIVTGSSLARMQIRRLFTQPYARVAATAAEGRAWVRHGVEPAAF